MDGDGKEQMESAAGGDAKEQTESAAGGDGTVQTGSAACERDLLAAAVVAMREPPALARALGLVRRWVLECDRGEGAVDGLSDAQAAGLALAAGLWREHREALDLDAGAALEEVPTPLASADGPVGAYTFVELETLTSTLQLEFRRLYAWEQGWRPLAEVDALLVAVLARLGFFLSHEFEFAGALGEAESAPPAAAPADGAAAPLLPAAAERSEPGWARLHLPAACRVLDAVHAMLSLHRLLRTAQCVPPWDGADERLVVCGHHREAALDAWNELCIVMDCPVGTITQYKHRFHQLFHSVSQVVYYHFPGYRRPTQLPLAQLQAPDPPPTSLLPVALELNPDIPVLHEHTGAGHAPTHAALPRAWVAMHGFVLLVDSRMRAFCAADLRSLAYAELGAA